MSTKETKKNDNKALHIGIVSGSFHFKDVSASIQNALHENGVSILSCVTLCDAILKNLEEDGMVVRNDR